MSRALVILSGGMDSATLAYYLRAEGMELALLTFDYRQRHRKEIDHAQDVAAALGAEHMTLDIAGVGRLLSGSALTDDIAVPDGHYADESMKVTVVPNRNAIFLSIAFGIAWARGADAVAIGVHAGDHPIYPDCRPEFIDQFARMEDVATEGRIRLFAPFVSMTKADIVKVGHRLAVPYELTWSCYKGGAMHCGTCGTCIERREAFAVAGVPDPTEYASADNLAIKTAQSQEPA